jgi:serine/threonine protein kinase/formylglycine-generating enzyme required for sulfatase activity
MARATRSALPFRPPERFDEYRVLRPLGHGTMGRVFLAQDTLLDRPVAIKFIADLDPDQPQGGVLPGLRDRFFVEARAIARLSHPNVVAIYRVGEWRRCPFLVSEFVRGESLDRLKKPQPWPEVLKIGIGLSRGLSAAHRRGVLHRDIKPANSMRTSDGEIKLLDFGLAKLTDVPLEAPRDPGRSQELRQSGILTPLPPVTGSETMTSPGLLAATLSGSATPVPVTVSLPPPALADAAAPIDESLSQTLPGQSAEDFGSPALPALTQVGDVIGSPLYMAPELWQGEPATRASDIYALGTMLYELAAGRAPYEGTPLVELPGRIGRQDVPPLATVATDVEPAFGAIIDRCLRRDPRARFASGDALREALEELAAQQAVAQTPSAGLRTDENPYRGLRSFDAEHRELFFGRAGEVRALVDRLRSEPLVIVTGDSGVGKSSLCQAGVLAELRQGVLGAVAAVRLVPGPRPLAALAAALATLLPGEEAGIADKLAQAPREVARALQLRRRRGGALPQALLFIDQMEELFTQCDAAAAAQFGEALGALLSDAPDLRVLGAVRSDFLSRLAALPGISAEVTRALHLIGPLSDQGLREAIVQPARRRGVHFESAELVQGLVDSARQAAGGLPLLQFALAELWEARDPVRRVIPAAALQALGGVGGALARHADGVFLRLPPPQRAAARRLLGLLITPEGTRAVRSGAELLGAGPAPAQAAASTALEALVRGRIIAVRSDDSGEGSVYELAHEALLTGWDTLRGWLARDVELRALRQRLAHAAAEWERLGRTPELLPLPQQLKEARQLPESTLLPREAAFLRAGERARARRRLRLWLLIGGAPLLLGLLYFAAELRARRGVALQIAGHLAQSRTELAEAQAHNRRVEELRQSAFAAFDRRDDAGGERLWDQMQALDAEARQAYRRANKSAEAAFMLDNQRRDVRETLATVLSERAQVVERNHFLIQRDELLQRLWLFDSDGSYRRRWYAPSVLALSSDPPGATVSVTPIDEQHRLRSAARRELGVTPLAPLELEPGSYVLSLSLAGRVAVRYPFLSSRGERLDLHVHLPSPAEVPAGFVYIPAGRSLFGSDAEDGQRRDFLFHVPIHPRTTPAFLIAQHETTYGEWLEYLRALPAAERARRLPHSTQAGLSGYIEVQPRPGGRFALLMQPTEHAYSAEEGSRLRYAARPRLAPPGDGPLPPDRQEQDWLRLPVSGISSEDARAYTRWLSESGRVPGARLCSENEWERVARGADERHYPHGDQLLPDDADFDQTYGQDPRGMGPDEVGSHPASRSLFGVDDLVGNVFEWVENSVSQKPFALRGGAYTFGARTCRIDNRFEAYPTMRNLTVGLRVCVTIR